MLYEVITVHPVQREIGHVHGSVGVRVDASRFHEGAGWIAAEEVELLVLEIEDEDSAPAGIRDQQAVKGIEMDAIGLLDDVDCLGAARADVAPAGRAVDGGVVV